MIYLEIDTPALSQRDLRQLKEEFAITHVHRVSVGGGRPKRSPVSTCDYN